MSKTSMFVTISVFWVLLVIASNMFEETLTSNTIREISIEDQETQGFFDSIFDTLDEVPAVNIVVPILKIMSFQYSDIIPGHLSALLSLTALFTGFILLSIWKGSG